MNAFSQNPTQKISPQPHRKFRSSLARIIATLSLSLFATGQLCAQVTLTTLHIFTGPDGSRPRASLLRASDGYFYGTTSQGGATNVANPAGTIFRIAPDGSFSNLYTFSFQVTGDTPYGGLIEGSDGNLYGTTRGTGSYDGNIFRIAKDGTGFTILHTLTGYFSGDGAHPQCNLLNFGGYLYGTTFDDGAGGFGIVFRVTPDGLVYTNLESLPGRSPAALTQGGDGNLYGISGENIFRVTSSNTALAVYTFNPSADGTSPNGALAKGVDGNLYGTTISGGAHNSSGTVFRFNGSGGFSNLYSFDTSIGDGSPSFGALLPGSDGNFYGTTAGGGGASGQGNVFRISPTGTISNLYSFAFSTTNGYSPEAGLVQGSDGNFYGTTFQGGSNNLGTVFKLTVPLASPPNQIPGFGRSTSNALITISTIAGEKYQLQTNDSIFSGSWSNAGSPFVGTGGPQTVTNSVAPSQSQKFYRFQITP